MRFKTPSALALCAVLLLGLTACDAYEDNLDFEVGSTLTVVGARSVTLTPALAFTVDSTFTATDTTLALSGVAVTPETAERGYYVQAYTAEKDYTWTFDGDAVTSECTGDNYPCLRVRSSAESAYTGEFIDVLFTERGSYTTAVAYNEYTGSISTTVAEPAVIGGCIADQLTVTTGESVSFDAVTGGPEATFTVDYGDDTDPATVAGFPTSYTYDEAGDYTATLTAENADGDASCTVDVRVRD